MVSGISVRYKLQKSPDLRVRAECGAPRGGAEHRALPLPHWSPSDPPAAHMSPGGPAVPESTVPADSAALRPVCTSRSAVTGLLQPAHFRVRIPVPAVPHPTAHQGWERQTLGLGSRSPFSSPIRTPNLHTFLVTVSNRAAA